MFERSIYRDMEDFRGELNDMQKLYNNNYKELAYLRKYEPSILAAPLKRRIGSYLWSCRVGEYVHRINSVPLNRISSSISH